MLEIAEARTIQTFLEHMNVQWRAYDMAFSITDIDATCMDLVKDKYNYNPTLSTLRGNFRNLKDLQFIEFYDVCETKNKIMFVVIIKGTTYNRAIEFDNGKATKYLIGSDCFYQKKHDSIKAYERAMRGI